MLGVEESNCTYVEAGTSHRDARGHPLPDQPPAPPDNSSGNGGSRHALPTRRHLPRRRRGRVRSLPPPPHQAALQAQGKAPTSNGEGGPIGREGDDADGTAYSNDSDGTLAGDLPEGDGKGGLFGLVWPTLQTMAQSQEWASLAEPRQQQRPFPQPDDGDGSRQPNAAASFLSNIITMYTSGDSHNPYRLQSWPQLVVAVKNALTVLYSRYFVIGNNIATRAEPWPPSRVNCERLPASTSARESPKRPLQHQDADADNSSSGGSRFRALASSSGSLFVSKDEIDDDRLRADTESTASLSHGFLQSQFCHHPTACMAVWVRKHPLAGVVLTWVSMLAIDVFMMWVLLPTVSLLFSHSGLLVFLKSGNDEPSPDHRYALSNEYSALGEVLWLALWDWHVLFGLLRTAIHAIIRSAIQYGLMMARPFAVEWLAMAALVVHSARRCARIGYKCFLTYIVFTIISSRVLWHASIIRVPPTSPPMDSSNKAGPAHYWPLSTASWRYFDSSGEQAAIASNDDSHDRAMGIACPSLYPECYEARWRSYHHRAIANNNDPSLVGSWLHNNLFCNAFEYWRPSELSTPEDVPATYISPKVQPAYAHSLVYDRRQHAPRTPRDKQYPTHMGNQPLITASILASHLYLLSFVHPYTPEIALGMPLLLLIDFALSNKGLLWAGLPSLPSTFPPKGDVLLANPSHQQPLAEHIKLAIDATVQPARGSVLTVTSWLDALSLTSGLNERARSIVESPRLTVYSGQSYSAHCWGLGCWLPILSISAVLFVVAKALVVMLHTVKSYMSIGSARYSYGQYMLKQYTTRPKCGTLTPQSNRLQLNGIADSNWDRPSAWLYARDICLVCISGLCSVCGDKPGHAEPLKDTTGQGSSVDMRAKHTTSSHFKIPQALGIKPLDDDMGTVSSSQPTPGGVLNMSSTARRHKLIDLWIASDNVGRFCDKHHGRMPLPKSRPTETPESAEGISQKFVPPVGTLVPLSRFVEKFFRVCLSANCADSPASKRDPTGATVALHQHKGLGHHTNGEKGTADSLTSQPQQQPQAISATAHIKPQYHILWNSEQTFSLCLHAINSDGSVDVNCILSPPLVHHILHSHKLPQPPMACVPGSIVSLFVNDDRANRRGLPTIDGGAAEGIGVLYARVQIYKPDIVVRIDGMRWRQFDLASAINEPIRIKQLAPSAAHTITVSVCGMESRGLSVKTPRAPPRVEQAVATEDNTPDLTPAHDKEYRELEGQLEAQRDAKRDATRRIKELSKQEAQWKMEVDLAQRSLAKQVKHSQKLKQHQTQIASDISRLRSLVTQTKKQLEGLKIELSELESEELQALKSEVSDEECDVSGIELFVGCDKTKLSMEAIRRQADQVFSEHCATIESLKQQYACLQNQLFDLAKEADEMKAGQLKSLAEESNRLDSMIQAASSHYRSVKERYNKVVATATSLHS
ncbi:hypothetical protein EV182_001486 [Spiromyces aspiralis]|uniref:Uncharacterized protein n=1 Tax=Spiromyces aspiralis TaxID=68401 RepID=A0ACC1HVM5_9FUNG|nr:hypothetical protein EV182_001486 [Spiromyces aspiralis]